MIYRCIGEHGPKSRAALDLAALLRVDPDRAREQIRAALDAHGGNRTRAARELGVSLRTLQRWLRESSALQALHTPAT